MTTNHKPEALAEERSSDLAADVMASIVVFLVALPLCIGLAMASGVPVARGLITGIVGGIVVGAVTGSPLLVSGPAASLLVLVWDLVHTHGLEMLGPVVVGAGLVQAIAGWLGLGQWFRAVSPAVIRGMMTGIGVLIVASQLHVVLDGSPGSSLWANLSSFPGALAQAFSEGRPALGVGLGTVAILVAWERYRPRRLSLVPPQLVAVVVVVGACQLFGLDVLYLEVEGGFFEGIHLTKPASMLGVLGQGLWIQCLIFAFVASAATLLTATAIDQVQSEVQTDYDQELFAQGVGNTVAGLLGGLPMTGVIVRSSANVAAGARTWRSTFLHGAWLLLFVALFPGVLGLIPKATLAAILVVVGCNLAHPDGMRKLDERGRGELVVGVITLLGVVGLDLFSGILLGLGASILRLVHAFTHFEVRVTAGRDDVVDVYLSGYATFLRLPPLAAALDAIPAGKFVKVHLQDLDYADHACLEQIAATQRRLKNGGGGLEVEWDELDRRYEDGPSPSGEASLLTRQLRALRRHLRAARRALRGGGEAEVVPGHLEVPPELVHLDLEGGELEAALRQVGTPLLEGLPGDADAALEDLVAKAGGQALDLGEGVILVHAYHPDVEGTRLGFARLAEPLRLATAHGDLLFVLLDREGDAETHLLALGGLARVCASPDRLEALRELSTPEEVAAELADGFSEAEDRSTSHPEAGSLLAVVELGLGTEEAPRALEEALRRTFGDVAVVDSSAPSSRLLAGALGKTGKADFLLVDVPPERVGSLHSLIDEFARTFPTSPPKAHLLEVRPSNRGVERKAVAK